MSKKRTGSKRKPKRVSAGKPTVSKGEAIYYIILWSMLLPLFFVIYMSSVFQYGLLVLFPSFILIFALIGYGLYYFLKD